MCVAIPYVPCGICCCVYLLVLSRSCGKAPLSSSTPILLLLLTLLKEQQALCLESDRCKLVGANNAWGVTSGSPSPHFLCSASLRGCHSGPDRWWGGGNKGRALHKSFCNTSSQFVCVQVLLSRGNGEDEYMCLGNSRLQKYTPTLHHTTHIDKDRLACCVCSRRTCLATSGKQNCTRNTPPRRPTLHTSHSEWVRE